MTNESNNTSSIISKVWSFMTILRDDGVGYGDYLEQLTYLLFLKMADEFSRPPYNRKLPIPPGYDWESLTEKRGGGTGNALHATPAGAFAIQRGAGPDLYQEPEQDSGPGQALQAHRHDRQGAVEYDGRGRQGQDLRGLAGKERRRH